MAKMSRLWAIALVAMFVSAPAYAEDETPDVREQLERAKEQTRKAHEKLKKALDARRQAEESARALYEVSRASRQNERRRDIRRAIAGGLEGLRALGGHEQLADRLQAVLGELSKKIESEGRHFREKHRNSPAVRNFPGGKKRAKANAQAEAVRVLAWRIGTLRVAMKALLEAKKQDAAELMERAIHTGELMLEGRTDNEAQKVFRQTPNLGQLSELLGVSSKLWSKWGNAKNAEATAKLAEYYQDRWQAQKAERRAARDEREVEDVVEAEDEEERRRVVEAEEDERRQRDHADRRAAENRQLRAHVHQLATQIAAMQERINGLTHKLQKIVNELK